ncbi:MAG: FAD-binding protein [Armatimonadota bacterium]|nr:MAG: FAD-binding protein [Armatimonadota bacterium]
MQRRHMATDILVVGNGGAGLRAAVAAAEANCRVLLLSKIGADRPNSTAVIAGWGAHVPPQDVESYFRMVVEEGNYLSDQDLAWQYATEVVDRMPELRRFGVEMHLAESTLERPGTARNLWYFPGPPRRLGDAIRSPLRRAASEKGATVLDDTLVTRLLTSDGSVNGATALDLTTGDLVVVSAKAVVLATGGASGLYARQNNPAGTTGDGFGLAYAAGAELVDMEFDTFMLSHQQLQALFTGRLTDEEALSTPGAHHSCGGVKVDLARRSTLPGLYVAGEAAGGTFGSARLGGSAVGDIIVSGCLAGLSAAETARDKPGLQLDQDQVVIERARLAAFFDRDGLPARALAREVRRVMWENMGPVRREAGLQSGLEKLRALRAKAASMSARNPRDLRHAVEVGFMLDVGEAIAVAALRRAESRGTHWRLDHPEPSNTDWLCNLIVRKGADGAPDLTARPVALSRITHAGPCRIGSAWTGGYVGLAA